jgi:hypothetical protein
VQVDQAVVETIGLGIKELVQLFQSLPLRVGVGVVHGLLLSFLLVDLAAVELCTFLMLVLESLEKDLMAELALALTIF